MEMTMEEKPTVAVSGFPELYDLNPSNTKKAHRSALHDEWTGERRICHLQPQLYYKLDIGHKWKRCQQCCLRPAPWRWQAASRHCDASVMPASRASSTAQVAGGVTVQLGTQSIPNPTAPKVDSAHYLVISNTPARFKVNLMDGYRARDRGTDRQSPCFYRRMSELLKQLLLSVGCNKKTQTNKNKISNTVYLKNMSRIFKVYCSGRSEGLSQI